MKKVIITIIVLFLSSIVLFADQSKPLYEVTWKDGSYYKVLQIIKGTKGKFYYGDKETKGVLVEAEIFNKSEDGQMIVATNLRLLNHNRLWMKAEGWLDGNQFPENIVQLPFWIQAGEKKKGWLFYAIKTDGEEVGDFVFLNYDGGKKAKWEKFAVSN